MSPGEIVFNGGRIQWTNYSDDVIGVDCFSLDVDGKNGRTQLIELMTSTVE